MVKSLAVLERFPGGRSTQGNVHPHALMGFHVLHVAADCPMLPMLVETGTPTIAQPAHAQPQSFTPNPQRIEHRTGAQQPDRWA